MKNQSANTNAFLHLCIGALCVIKFVLKS